MIKQLLKMERGVQKNEEKIQQHAKFLWHFNIYKER